MTGISIPNDIIQIQNNNVMCEVNGCYEQATNEIRVNTEHFGQISLFICKDCLPKFKVK